MEKVIIMAKIKVSVHDIVDLLFMNGHINNEFVGSNLMQEGIKAHQTLQKKCSDDDIVELSVKLEHTFEEFEFLIGGRIDIVSSIDDTTSIEEIKSTRKDLMYIEEVNPAHLAQAKMYAYIYATTHKLDCIYTKNIYVNLDTYETKSFENKYTIDELTYFFEGVMNDYLDFYRFLHNHSVGRKKEIKELEFPFDKYREGQRKMMGHVYMGIKEKQITYINAPTGIGKTISSIFPALKALTKSNQKLFYLTAKNSGKNAAFDTAKLLTKNSKSLISIVLNSKTSMCFKDEQICDPDTCEGACNFYDHLLDATRKILDEHHILDSKTIYNYALDHEICPFEFSLYLSYYADLVICDYNYAFDPKSHLIRYFDDDKYKPILLIDESHNLVSRSKDMYSSSINESVFRNLLNLNISRKINELVHDIIEIIDEEKVYLVDVEFIHHLEIDQTFLKLLAELHSEIEKILNDDNFKINDELTLLYFDVNDFVKISSFFNKEFLFIEKIENREFIFEIKCLNASQFVLDTVNNKTIGSVFFSATLYPPPYHTNLLTQGEGNFIGLSSPFEQDNLLLLINNSISTKYRDRNRTLPDLIEVIKLLTSSKKGKHIVFFPSYAYLKMVYDRLDDLDEYTIIQQESEMSFDQRNKVINLFKKEDSNILGLFVMGGIFSEGIDYLGNMLDGVIVVSVGIPRFSQFNELVKKHYDETFENGYDYAYTYPGFNKVVQAAGRVIRSETDRGVVILIDSRFTSKKYLSLFPSFWSHGLIVNRLVNLQKCLSDFYEKTPE